MKSMLMAVFLTCSVSVAHAAEVGEYITGGIGASERAEFDARRSEFNFEVKTALKTGHYLADVVVTITNEAGQVILDAQTDGPLFYAKLAPGKYTVKAIHGEQTQSQSITIVSETAMREAIFRFDGQEAIIDKDEQEDPYSTLDTDQ